MKVNMKHATTGSTVSSLVCEMARAFSVQLRERENGGGGVEGARSGDGARGRARAREEGRCERE